MAKTKSELPINQIICGDCREIIENWPDGCIDLILTDPPYQFQHGREKKLSQNVTKKKKDGKGDWYLQGNHRRCLEEVDKEFGMNFEPQEFFPLLIRLQKQINLYTFTYKSSLPWFLNFVISNHLSWDLLIWWKRNAIPINKGHYLIDKEYVVFMRGNNAYFNSNIGYGSYHTIYPGSVFEGTKRKHPNQKPLKFIENMIRISSKPNDILLDPFCGSGTTCIAAKKLGRRYIGIDINEKYCKIARERLNLTFTKSGVGLLECD